MQHISVKEPITTESVQRLLDELIIRELLTEEQKNAVDTEVIVSFFDSEIGKRMQRAPVIRREVPFTLAVPASEAYFQLVVGKKKTFLFKG